MNQYMSFILVKTNIENFSLFKEKKNKIFGYYKTKRYKYNNHYNKINFINSISRNDLIISKVIDFYYINSVQKEKINVNKFLKRNKDKIELIKNKTKYCKNKMNKSLDNKNILIRPIMLEDTLFYKKK